ncbi:hypothetical protein KWG64_18470 [Rahnella sp. PD12R]|uniref:hypothetical protein n=1 Tax=Rahnella sp. PD12R TaxID=2855688 RepID=UPI001C447B76|nr:hypothetical protein [Rahnella sp. PD12R]MBV6819932.1 hypothetical protein [Rahnella sp. PD12R]
MYGKVISSLNEVKPSSKHLTDITKIVNQTEDDDLKKLLTPVIIALTEHSTLSTPLVRKQPRNFISGAPFDAVYRYCLPKIQARIPEWQVIARQEGWTPPPEPE